MKKLFSLFLGAHKCYSDLAFHDGYAIPAKDFKNFRFVKNENGTFCVDQNGFSYRKIADKLSVSGHGYEFKSEDLREFFTAFVWYKPNPAFTEKELSQNEKSYIERIQRYEK